MHRESIQILRYRKWLKGRQTVTRLLLLSVSKHDCATTYVNSNNILFNFAMSRIVNDISLCLSSAKDSLCPSPVSPAEEKCGWTEILFGNVWETVNTVIYCSCIFSMDNEEKPFQTEWSNHMARHLTEEKSFSRPWMLITNLWRYHLTATRSLTEPVPRLCSAYLSTRYWPKANCFSHQNMSWLY